MGKSESEEPARRLVEDWARDKHVEAHWLAALRFAHHWGLGRAVSESEFDAALDAVQRITLS